VCASLLTRDFLLHTYILGSSSIVENYHASVEQKCALMLFKVLPVPLFQLYVVYAARV